VILKINDMKLIAAMVFVLVSLQGKSQIADTAAIRQLLEKESATWRSGDIKAHADCWHVQPYSKIFVSTPEGKSYDIPVKNIVSPSPDMVGKGGYAVNSNYNFVIHGKNAWVSHDERSYSKDGNVSYSHEIRILEKIKGKWKLVAQSVHVYNP